MDRKKIAEDIIAKLKEDELLEIIKKAEQEEARPLQIKVQVRVDNPQSFDVNEYQSRGVAKTIVNNFYDRPIHVKRINKLPAKYEHDVALIEGNWKSIRELHERIGDLNVLNTSSCVGTHAKRVHLGTEQEKIYAMIRKEFDMPELDCLLHVLYDESSHPDLNCPYQALDGSLFLDTKGRITIPKICEFLTSKEIEFIVYPLNIKPYGVCDDRTQHREMAPVNETLIANITYRN